MPNVGRPSKGCKNCRDRKVKCDLKRPSCSQCIRTGKLCHGYRDPLAMMFKNESEVVAKKAEKRYEELSKQKSQNPAPAVQQENKDPESESSDASSSSSETSPPQSEQQIVPAQPWSMDNVTLQLLPSLEDQAIGFFYSKYVIEPAAVPRGSFEWLSDFIYRPDTAKILQTSVEAASLAGLANSTKNPFIMKKAQAAYGSALTLTNQALISTETAKLDSTLIAVIMLGMFENFAFQDKNSLKAWAKHVNGACTLLKLRGKEQFKNSMASRIFLQFYGTVLLVSLEFRQPIPEGIAELWEVASSSGDYSVQGKQWTTRLVRFMHNAIDLAQDRKTDPMTMVKRAMGLDRELDSIKALIPNIWKYETVYLEKPDSSVYGNVYHIYLDPWISQMWNNLRSCRLGLHRVLREQLQKGAELFPTMFPVAEVQVQIEASKRVMQATAASVCASVAQITGQIPFPDTSNKKSSPSSSFSDFAHPDDPKYKLHPQGTFLDPFKPTGMMHLIWPVYAVGESDLSSNDLRQWAIDQLYFVAHTIGTRQAVVLAEDLKRLQKSGSVFEVSDEAEPFLKSLLLPV